VTECSGESEMTHTPGVVVRHSGDLR
jgi:hypothetical protein